MATLLRLAFTSIALLILATTISTPGVGQPAFIVGDVLSVVEGDRLQVLLSGAEMLDVKLAGIDTPEITQGMCYSIDAREYVNRQIFGRTVYLQTISTGGPGPTTYNLYLDQFGTQLFNAQLVEEGYAVTLSTLYEQNQINARSNARGLWGECFNANPRLVILSVDFFGEDQVVTIMNQSDEPVNVAGWQLASSPWEEFAEWCSCPDITMAPNEQVRVHSGSAATSDSPNDFVCSSFSIWRAAGDSAWLIDSEGRYEGLFEYGGGYREL